MTRPRLAVDIGGTFTDVAVERGGSCLTSKVLTTPGDPVRGVLDGVRLALVRAELAPPDIGAVVHGTTLATNALIERRGATVGTIVTEGFRDILEIAYERRYDQYDLGIEKPDTLVPRERVATVAERVAAAGQVLEPLDPRERAPRRRHAGGRRRREPGGLPAARLRQSRAREGGPGHRRESAPPDFRSVFRARCRPRSASSTGSPRRWPMPASSR